MRSRQRTRNLKYWETKLRRRKQRSMQHILALMESRSAYNREHSQHMLDRNEKRVKDIERKIEAIKGDVIMDG